MPTRYFLLLILDSFTRIFPPFYYVLLGFGLVKLGFPFKTMTYWFLLGFESFVSAWLYWCSPCSTWLTLRIATENMDFYLVKNELSYCFIYIFIIYYYYYIAYFLCNVLCSRVSTRVMGVLFFTAQRALLITKFLKILPLVPYVRTWRTWNKPSKSMTYKNKRRTQSRTW